MRLLPTLAAAVLLVAAGGGGAAAQSVEAFYKANRVSIDIGYTPGGVYDIYARTVARHLGKHIPGRPAVVPVNMPGAGSMKARTTSMRRRPRTARISPCSRAASPCSRCSTTPACNSKRPS